MTPRKRAKIKGQLFYFTGLPCVRGHVAKRYLSGRCVECIKITRRAWYVSNKERTRLNRRKWHVSNTDAVRTHSANRRSQKKQAKGKFTEADIKILFKKQKGKCNHCPASFKKVKYTIDHIRPLSKGGSNWPNNLQLLCQPCNDSKGASWPH